MKRNGLILTSVVGLLIGCLFITSCVSQNEVKLISENAGLFSVVSWIAIDNPTPDQLKAVSKIVDIVKTNCIHIQSGKTYLETVYPVILPIIDKQFEAQYRPLAKASAISLLGGLDMLFAKNPDWKKSEAQVLEVIGYFCDGAKQGFSLAETNPLIRQARNVFSKRAENKK